MFKLSEIWQTGTDLLTQKKMGSGTLTLNSANQHAETTQLLT